MRPRHDNRLRVAAAFGGCQNDRTRPNIMPEASDVVSIGGRAQCESALYCSSIAVAGPTTRIDLPSGLSTETTGVAAGAAASFCDGLGAGL